MKVEFTDMQDVTYNKHFFTILDRASYVNFIKHGIYHHLVSMPSKNTRTI
jgi:hypothetical protein